MTTKPTILIVDDSALVLEMARDYLERGGYSVLTAASGIEANRYIFGTPRPDLIILDVMLPMLDGNKKAKLLKEKDSSRDIPIYLLSSKTEEELRNLMSEAGADGFIRKPFTQAQITAKVAEALGKRSGRPA